MTKFRRFFVKYMMLPLLMPALSAVFAAYMARSEVNAGSYATLTAVWPRLHQPARQAITQAFANGKISQWDYHPLFDLVVNDTNGFTLPDPRELGTTEQEREKLRAVMQHGA
ncbi:TPA: hypothetical protein ACK3Q6_007662 [Burkholderia cepacia]